MKEPWERAKASDSTPIGCWWLRCVVQRLQTYGRTCSVPESGWPSQAPAWFRSLCPPPPESGVWGPVSCSGLSRTETSCPFLSTYLWGLQYTGDLFPLHWRTKLTELMMLNLLGSYFPNPQIKTLVWWRPRRAMSHTESWPRVLQKTKVVSTRCQGQLWCVMS